MLLLSANPELDHHDTGGRHPERPSRIPAALEGIDDAGLRDAVVELAPRRALAEELVRVHPERYLDLVEDFCRAGGGALDPDTIVGPGSWDTALLAAGGVLAAVDALAGGGGDTAFVAARPPGHHALAEQSMGFCMINNIAVGAAASGRTRGTGAHRGLRRPPRQRDPGHLLGRSPRAVHLDPRVAPLPRDRPDRGDRWARGPRADGEFPVAGRGHRRRPAEGGRRGHGSGGGAFRPHLGPRLGRLRRPSGRPVGPPASSPPAISPTSWAGSAGSLPVPVGPSSSSRGATTSTRCGSPSGPPCRPSSTGTTGPRRRRPGDPAATWWTPSGTFTTPDA